MKLLGEALGFIAIFIGFFVFQQKDRKKLLRTKLICDILWATHFGLIGAFSGMAISVVAAFRAITFSSIRRDENRKSILFLFLFEECIFLLGKGKVFVKCLQLCIFII